MDESRRALTPGGFSALSAGTVLDRYRIDSLIAAGGFGITYLCHHITLGKPYALKEHFPRQFAYRDESTMDVRPTDPETFSWALDRFIQEGRALASCHHPNVVNVADVFEANQTAYMVLGYEEGRSLKSWLDRLGRPPTQGEIDAILAPLLDALGYVHAQGLLHRDIAPDNIMIRSDGKPCLIDFGSARQAVAARSQVMSALVKSGYSPPEQYTSTGRMQGPWSDIYAMGATLYRMVTGTTLPDSTDRSIEDAVRPVRETIPDPGAYRASFLDGIDKALAFHYSKRPQSIDEWRGILFDGAASPAEATPAPPPSSAISPSPPAPLSIASESPASAPTSPPATSGRRSRSRKALIVVAALVLIGGAGIAMSMRQAANERAAAIFKAEENDRDQRQKEAMRAAAAERATKEQAQKEAKAALDKQASEAEAKRQRIETEQEAAVQRREAAARAEREREVVEQTARARAAIEAARLQAEREAEEARAAEARRKRLEEERRIAALQEESAQRLAREREDAARAAKERADAAAATAISSPNRAFDGHWYSPEWKYGYRLQDGVGIASSTNSPRFSVGDVIIRIRAVAPKVFEGEQVYRDGRWYRIRGELRSDGRIYISGEKNVNWHMERID
jgi:serine/threonine protein kinase